VEIEVEVHAVDPKEHVIHTEEFKKYPVSQDSDPEDEHVSEPVVQD